MAPLLNRSHKIRSAVSKIAFWKSHETRELWNRSNRIVPFIEPELAEDEEKVDKDMLVIDLDTIQVYEWPEVNFETFGENGFYTKAECTMETLLMMSPLYNPKPSLSQPEQKAKKSLLQRASHRIEKRTRYAVSTVLSKKPEKSNNPEQSSQKITKDDSGFTLF